MTTTNVTASPILALDLGKYKSVACLYRSANDHRFLSFSTSREELARLLDQHRPAVVLIEACLLAGWVHDLCADQAVRCLVANTASEAWKFKHTKRKTDRDDALRLAQLYVLGQFPAVAVPTADVRQKRALIETRQKLVGRRVALQNRIRAIFVNQGLPAPRGVRAWTKTGLAGIAAQARPLTDCALAELWRGRLHLALTELAQIKQLLDQAEARLDELAKADADMQILDGIPGVGPRTAEAVAAFLPEPKRFRTGKQVSAYGGFVPRQYQSSETDHRGRISKRGPKTLRKLLVECAWAMLRYNRWARAVYRRLTHGGQVRQLRDVRARQKRLENQAISAYRQLPAANQIDTITGIGDVTAAVLTAFILDIDRFRTPGQLVKCFGTLPIEVASGVDRDGQPRGPRRYVMSRPGHDQVRRYLWMAALSAIRFNPAVRALYARVVARHPNHKAIAVGHAMRKLLHLVFAIWKTGKPFDRDHCPWPTPEQAGQVVSDMGMSQEKQAAGLKPESVPARKEVAAACPDSIPPADAAHEGAFIDFAHLKKQLPIARVLEHLGLASRLRGAGAQKRCACPIHRGDGRGRTFSVNLEQQVFHCFDARCQKQGDVIDLWAALHQLSLRQAALDLVETFHLEAAPRTEKRNG